MAQEQRIQQGRRPFRVGDIVRSKITGHTGPVLRVEQYGDGTPRITAELTKRYDVGQPSHHFELVRSADDGRVHDVVEAERQAYAVEAEWAPVVPDPYFVEYARALTGRGRAVRAHLLGED